jgi:hypothetical protein
MAKVIQISATTDEDNDPVLFALCDDGSIWCKYEDGVWQLVEDVPR